MSSALGAKLRGPGSTPVSSQEAGNKGRRGERSSAGGSSTYTGEDGRHPSKKVRNPRC